MVSEVISQLAVGEALVSTLADKGVPTMVERTLIAPPRCRMGPATTEELTAIRHQSPIGGKYDTLINRESAYERLNQRHVEATNGASSTNTANSPAPQEAEQGWFSELIFGNKQRQVLAETLSKQAARTVGNQLGKQILRGLLGGILGKSPRR